MDRASATSYLQAQYSDLADAADFTTGDTAAAYSTAIDQSLRALGVTETALPNAVVVDTQVVAYCALLDYYALERYLKKFAMMMTVTISRTLQVQRGQMFTHTEILYREAGKKLILLGVGPVEMIQPVRYELDFLEPDLTMTGEV